MFPHRKPRFAAFLVAVGALALVSPCVAQAPGLTRHDLQRHDLDTPGQETLQTRVDFAPGAVAPRHRHPGEEIVYVLKGQLVYEIDGQPARTLGPGDVAFIPTGTWHSVRNVTPLADGGGEAWELATYVVAKGKPLVELAR